MASIIQSIQISRIKNLIDVEIRLDEDKNLTAIMGPNGYGKSTILHVIAASFRADKIKRQRQDFEIGESRRFSEFFPTTPHYNWAGTSLKVITKEIGYDEALEIKQISISKAEAGAWLPLQESKPMRETYFIGVSSAVPEIESRRDLDDIIFSSSQLKDDISTKLKKRLSSIFNKDYTAVFDHEVSAEKKLIGLGHGGIEYSSLAMGAGEQRVFFILKTALSCEKNALLLIDEIDLLLHTEALDRLLTGLTEIAQKKNLQVLFTTHRESVLSHVKDIAVRHIYNQPNVAQKTYCFNDSKPGAIRRLTGVQPRSLSICCEDDVAEAIIRRVGQQVGVSAHIQTQLFGAWQNCFTLAAALTFREENLSNTLLIMDGDISECDTTEKKKEIINKRLTGTGAQLSQRKNRCLELISEFCPPIPGTGPEKSLYDMVCALNPEAEISDAELIRTFLSVTGVVDKHHYVDRPFELLGENRQSGLARLISAVDKCDAWQAYTAPLRGWLGARKTELLEHPELTKS